MHVVLIDPFPKKLTLLRLFLFSAPPSYEAILSDVRGHVSLGQVQCMLEEQDSPGGPPPYSVNDPAIR